jgi:hypothetical protein
MTIKQYNSRQLAFMNLQHFRQHGTLEALFVLDAHFSTQAYLKERVNEGLQSLQIQYRPFIAVYRKENEITIYCSPCREKSVKGQVDLTLGEVWARLSDIIKKYRAQCPSLNQAKQVVINYIENDNWFGEDHVVTLQISLTDRLMPQFVNYIDSRSERKGELLRSTSLVQAKVAPVIGVINRDLQKFYLEIQGALDFMNCGPFQRLVTVQLTEHTALSLEKVKENLQSINVENARTEDLRLLQTFQSTNFEAPDVMGDLSRKSASSDSGAGNSCSSFDSDSSDNHGEVRDSCSIGHFASRLLSFDEQDFMPSHTSNQSFMSTARNISTPKKMSNWVFPTIMV